MPGLANVFFRDIFSHQFGGILPQTLASATTTSGSAIQLGGVGGMGKLLFRLITTNATAAFTASMYLSTATASNGSLTSISATLVSLAFVASSTSALLQYLEIDTRNEAFANLATGSAAPSWVVPVVVLAGSGTPIVALDVLGWEYGNDPAKNYDAGSTLFVCKETDFY